MLGDAGEARPSHAGGGAVKRRGGKSLGRCFCAMVLLCFECKKLTCEFNYAKLAEGRGTSSSRQSAGTQSHGGDQIP